MYLLKDWLVLLEGSLYFLCDFFFQYSCGKRERKGEGGGEVRTVL